MENVNKSTENVNKSMENVNNFVNKAQNFIENVNNSVNNVNNSEFINEANQPEIDKKVVVNEASEAIELEQVDNMSMQTLTNDKGYKVRMIRATSKVSTCLNENWYAFDFSETREITDDSKIAEIRADLWNTVNSEVDNQVQYTIDSIIGVSSGGVSQPSNNPYADGPMIPEEYNL